MTGMSAARNSDLLITLAADIVSAHVSHNRVAVDEMAGLIMSVRGALQGLSRPTEALVPKQKPAVSIRASVKQDYIVCLEDGKKLRTLKRHLMTHYQMTPEAYRAKWKLPADYPMVAPSYAQHRKELALKIGLGRKAGATKTAAKKASGPKTASKTKARSGKPTEKQDPAI